MPPQPRGNRILAPLDENDLMNRGLLGTRDSNGSRRMHKRRLHRSSDEENSQIPLDILPQSPEASAAFTAIPDELISPATLEYVGFSGEKALHLWDTWTNWPPSGPQRETDPDDGGLRMTFLDFITGPFDTSVDTSSDNDDDWKTCMNQYGLGSEVQLAILDPNFKYLRLSQSCAAWAKDTIEMRYAGLQEIQAASLERDRALHRATTRAGSSQGESSTQEDITGASHGSSTIDRRGRRSVSGLQREHAPSISANSWNSASAMAARNAPGHVVLFKAIDQGRISGLVDDHGALQNITALISAPPSDFSGRQGMYYLTPDFQVAQYYAAYAKRRANSEAIVIITIAVPNYAVESMEEPDILRVYWPSPEWKELVWLCRKNMRLTKPLRKYRDATLIIGTIARKPNSAYQLLESPEEITETYILKTDGANGQRSAVQFVFSGEEGETFLTQHISQDITIFPFTRGDFEKWVEENEVSFPWMDG